MAREEFVSGFEGFTNVFVPEILRRKALQDEQNKLIQVELAKKGYMFTPGKGVSRIPGYRTGIEALISGKGGSSFPQTPQIRPPIPPRGFQPPQGFPQRQEAPGQGAFNMLQGQGQSQMGGYPQMQPNQLRYPFERILPPGSTYEEEGIRVPLTAPAEKYPTIQQNRDTIIKIRNDFKKDTEYFKEARRFSGAMNSQIERLIQNPNLSRIGIDNVLLVGLKKVLEPDSAVMQGEFASTAEGGAPIAKLHGYLQKLIIGGHLDTDEERFELVATANSLLDAAGNQYNKEFKRAYTRDVPSLGFNPNMVLGGYRPYHPDKKSFRGDIDYKKYILNRQGQVPKVPQTRQQFKGDVDGISYTIER